ncbi:MAG: hypothetical protein MZV70_67070 [Desulfobacterales bacterium]|nr:hypothetical protein [Desulfobacterales bacterium]
MPTDRSGTCPLLPIRYGKQWIGAVADAMGKQPKFQAAPKLVVQVMGLFMPIMKEMVEMLYQYDRDYVFDSGKFENRFGFKPTPYLDGIREVVEINYELRITNYE